MDDMKKQKIQPLSDRVLLLDISEDKKKTKSGIILPDSNNKSDGIKKAQVVAVGPGRYDGDDLIPMTLKPGDEVIYTWGEKIVIEEQDYFLVRESDILAKIN